tara:strand:- start:708 stop:1436 length:729 start_codon:yes stop_codon:yes gene_type:complete
MKNIIKNFVVIFLIIVIYSFNSNTIIEELESTKWISLFDGKSFNGWHQYNGGPVSNKWIIENGVMIFDPKKSNIQNDGTGNIVTDQEFTNFELSLEWNISNTGNSGMFWGVKELDELNDPYMTGAEIQILDNDRHPDAKANPKFHQAGALYDMVQPESDVCKAAGQWNRMILKINHAENIGSVTLNGTKIVVFPLAGPKWAAMVYGSKFKNWPYFGAYKTGKIGLQDHGDKVSFRNIKIREL